LQCRHSKGRKGTNLEIEEPFSLLSEFTMSLVAPKNTICPSKTREFILE
jgi:hypothetical protein